MVKNKKSPIDNANLWLWMGAVFCCLLGLALILFAVFPDIEPVVGREQLQTKEVTVSVLDYHVGHRSANTYYILTTEGYKYIISGSFDRWELVQNVTAGKTVTVKWYRQNWPQTYLAEEIFADGKQVVFYDNDRRLDWRIILAQGFLSLLMGISFFSVIRYDRKLEKESREKKSKKRKGK